MSEQLYLGQSCFCIPAKAYHLALMLILMTESSLAKTLPSHVSHL